MGLDTTHNCWHGAYSGFMAFRKAICTAAYGEDLEDMWREESLPKDDALTVLLNHSDCDGVIEHKDCHRLAVRLLELIPLVPEVWKPDVLQFASGLTNAHAAGEDVEFH